MNKREFIGVAALCAAASLVLRGEASVRLDISGETARQTVIAEGGRTLPSGYQGHPTTVLTREGKLICVWTFGHGGPCGPAAESVDGGRTWTRIDDRFPAVYRETHKNCPTLQKCVCRDGHERLFVFSAKRRDPTKMKAGFETFSWRAPLGIMISDDGGRTWREGTPAEVSSNMPPTGFMHLKDGSLALFGQVRLDAKVKTDKPNDDQGVWMSVSRDDGETWSPMRVVAQAKERNLCEPCCLRSPDGKTLALLIRENRHRDCSMMCFSSDEGQTWTKPVLTAPELTGDRHEGIMLDDGRYLVCFRDQMKKSPTLGQFVGWVGSWQDLVSARSGDLRIRLLNHHGKHGVWPGNEIDTGYSGVEKLADGTILCTTYTKHFDDGRHSSVVATRLYPSDLRKVSPVRVRPVYPCRMDLEWNVNYQTDIAYEVEINTNKIASGNRGFAVYAKNADGEKRLDVTTLAGSRPDSVALRFVVPAGTAALAADAGVGTLKLKSAAEVENLFKDALTPSAKWTADDTIRHKVMDDGVHFLNPDFSINRYAKYTVAVPADWRGKNVRFEMDCVSEAQMTWAGYIRIAQYYDESATHPIPVSVTDPRWTSHFRPPAKPIAYRVNGRIHPEAKSIRLMIELRGNFSKYNAKGLPLANAEDGCARLRVSHLALRRGEELPFPKYDASFFVKGSSDKPGDTALKVGDERGTAFFFATRGQGCWADGQQIRDENEIFFPTGSGTIEAQFNPTAWPKKANEKVFLFDAHTGYHYHNVPDRGEVVALAYVPATKTLSMWLMDLSNTVYRASAQAKLPLGQWTHLAVSWTVGKKARLFMNGHCLATASLDGFVPMDLENVKKANEDHASEFFLGGHYNTVRALKQHSPKTYPLFNGAVDALRISTGARYTDDFTPEAHPSVDAKTRSLFNFDHSYDGVSGSGDRFILGSVLSTADRVDHQLKLGGKTIQYYPKEILPGNDPAKVLDDCNYPNLPTPTDFNAARSEHRWSGRVEANQQFSLTAEDGAIADFVEFANLGSEPLVYPFLLNEGDVDARSFGDLRESLKLAGKSDREKANAIFQFVMRASDYFMNHSACFTEGTDKFSDVEYRELMMLNGYCGFECGPLNNMAASLFANVADLPASQTGGYRHSFEQVFFEGKNHIYDLSFRTFFPAMDNETTAYLREVEDQPGGLPRVGGTLDHFVRQITRGAQAYSPKFNEKVGFVLNPGERFRAHYSNNGEVNDLQCNWTTVENYAASRKTRYDSVCHGVPGREGSIWRIDRFFPHYGNGFLIFDGKPGSDNPAFEVDNKSVVYRVRNCYPIVAADYAATLTDGTRAKLDISTDGGRTWRALPDEHLRYQVRARNAYLIRINANLEKIKDFHASTEVMFNSRIFPGRVHAGDNRYTLKAENSGTAEVTIGYRIPEKTIEIVGGAYAGTIIGNERQLVVLDPSKPLELKVRGASANATVSASEGIAAFLDNGKLTLIVRGARESSRPKWLGTVTVSDNEAKRELTVLVCEKARLVTVAKRAVAVSGSAKLLAADQDRVQPCVMMTDTSSQAKFTFDKLPSGRYAVMQVVRFPHQVEDPMVPRLEMTFGGRTMPTAIYDNYSANFLKAKYGRSGRAAFKWEYPFVERVPWYNDQMMVWKASSPVSDVKFKGVRNEPNGVEIAAVLVVPIDRNEDTGTYGSDDERTFFCELVKTLCGLNTRGGK